MVDVDGFWMEVERVFISPDFLKPPSFLFRLPSLFVYIGRWLVGLGLLRKSGFYTLFLWIDWMVWNWKIWSIVGMEWK
jgi:hypothetical protein